MLRNRFSAKLIGLILTTLFFSGLQSVSAVEVKATDVSIADTCSVSLKSVWSSYGIPYPCFTNGTALNIKTPPPSKGASSLYVRINTEARSIVSSAYVSIPTYQLGLNEVFVADKNSPLFKSGWSPRDSIDSGLKWTLGL